MLQEDRTLINNGESSGQVPKDIYIQKTDAIDVSKDQKEKSRESETVKTSAIKEYPSRRELFKSTSDEKENGINSQNLSQSNSLMLCSEYDEISSISDSSSEISESESFTDVTPLHSPYCCDSPVPQVKGSYISAQECIGLSQASNSHNMCMDVTESILQKAESLPQQKKDTNLLVEAVKRLELQIHCPRNSSAQSSGIEYPSSSKRKNMSFSNDTMRKIDTENQRLLKKIISHQNRLKTKPSSHAYRIASSAINRHKQQRQIEMENMALLKRIEKAKPTSELKPTRLRHSASTHHLKPSSNITSHRRASADQTFKTKSLESEENLSLSSNLTPPVECLQVDDNVDFPLVYTSQPVNKPLEDNESTSSNPNDKGESIPSTSKDNFFQDMDNV